MKTQCPYCKQHYEVDDCYLGSNASCEICKKDFVIKEMPKLTVCNLSNGTENPKETANRSSNWGAKIKNNKGVFFIGVAVLALIAVAIVASIPSEEEKLKKKEQKIYQMIQDNLAYLNSNTSVSEFKLVRPYSKTSSYEIRITLKEMMAPQQYKSLCDSAAKKASTTLVEQKNEKTTCKATLLLTNKDTTEKRDVYVSKAENGHITESETTTYGFAAYRDSLPPAERDKFMAEHRLNTFKEKIDSDGSVIPVVEYVKSRMKNPDSFQHIATQYSATSSSNERFKVQMSFRGTNSFGGLVPQTATVDVNYLGWIYSSDF